MLKLNSEKKLDDALKTLDLVLLCSRVAPCSKPMKMLLSQSTRSWPCCKLKSKLETKDCRGKKIFYINFMRLRIFI